MFTPHSRPTQIFGVGHVLQSPTWRTLPTHHGHHELICVLKGCLHVAGNGRTYEGKAGDLFLYPAGVEHEEWSDPENPMESYFIGFACPIQPPCGIRHVHDPRGRIADMLRWMHEDALTGGDIRSKEYTPMMAAILTEFNRALTDPTEPWVNKVRHHIRQHISEPIALSTLASVAEMSRYHFLRTYRKATGLTPMADVRFTRVQYARQLIMNTSLPLKEVAEMAGLPDVYSLSKAFRKCLDITPSSLRRTNRP